MFESEDAFVESFVASVTPSVWSRTFRGKAVRSVYESDCSDGRADWVWARSAEKWPRSWSEETAQVLQNPTCSRILAYLKLSSPRSDQFLRDRVGVATGTFDRAVRDLIRVNLVHRTQGQLLLLSRQAELPDVEICAFEFKLKNWKRAFFQASRYRSFANRVYVVMPEATVGRADKQLEAFQRHNIGLIAFDENSGARRVLVSNKQKPRSRSSYIQALGMLHQWG